MANLNTKTLDQLVTEQVAAVQTKIQASISIALDWAIGSVLRAIVEANGAVALWMQGLLLQVLVTTRAATSTGADLDSWAADFSFTRLPATYASGSVTFSRFTTTLAAFIPVGTQIQTTDASPEIFAVIADTNNIAYSAVLGGYTINAGVSALPVKVQCTTAGSAGNVLAGQCSLLTGSIPAVDTVTNAAQFTNGLDAESDSAFRARFVSYLTSLSKATKNAISAAVSGVQQGLTFTLTENYDQAGNIKPGYFYVVVDDGSGAPSGTLLASISNAVDAVRAFTVTFDVIGPVMQTANIAVTITSNPTGNHTADAALVQAAITSYINGLGIGGTLYYSRLMQVAYDASATVANVTGLTINGGTADLVATAKQRNQAGTVVVS